jgi:hypothetical protein
MIKNRTIYFPAMGSGTQLISIKKDVKHIKNGMDFRNYSDNALIYHPYMLFSAGHLLKKINFIKEVGIDLNKNIVLGDSGGYQVATGVLKYTDAVRETIFNWLENNTSYAMNLDIPPWNLNDHDYNGYKKLALDSSKNFEYFHKNDSKKTKFMNVLQGRNLKTLNIWYDAVKDFDFEGGWGIGGTSINIFYVLQSLFFLYGKGEFKKYNNKKALIHVLGFSKASMMHYLMYFQAKLNNLGYNITITYDSSTPFIQASFGNYFISARKEGIDLCKISHTIPKNDEYINFNTELPCKCNICKDMTWGDLWSFLNDKKSFKTEFYYYVASHNFSVFLTYQRNIENLINIDNKTILNSYFSEREKRIFKIIDECFTKENPAEFLQTKKEICASIDLDAPIIRKEIF